MKSSIRFLLAAGCLLLAGGAAAQIDPNPDGIGIYADLAGMTNSIQAEPNEAIEVYLLATRTTYDLDGAEFKIIAPANAMVWGFTCPYEFYMLLNLDDGSMQVAFGMSPLPPGDVAHIMTFIIMMTDAEPGYFSIGPSFVNSGGFDSPVYGSFDLELHPLHPYPGGDAPSFSVNAPATPVQPETWGGVKAMFRS